MESNVDNYASPRTRHVFHLPRSRDDEENKRQKKKHSVESQSKFGKGGGGRHDTRRPAMLSAAIKECVVSRGFLSSDELFEEEFDESVAHR